MCMDKYRGISSTLSKNYSAVWEKFKSLLAKGQKHQVSPNVRTWRSITDNSDNSKADKALVDVMRWDTQFTALGISERSAQLWFIC